MPWLRGNLHAHTTWSDGVKTPAELIAEYESRGYDFLAITDHENLIPQAYWKSLPRLAARLLLFHGVELNWNVGAPGELREQHVGKVLGDRETLYVLNHPARYRLSVPDTLERIRRIGRDGVTLDAVEVTDTGQHRPLYAAGEIPLAKIATDDAHWSAHFGRAWIEVDAARQRDAIIRAIRAGDFRLGLAPPTP
jgi:predicted metal-dependent phosphoesterase TrpH